MLISSQKYLNDEIVALKRKIQDYVVTISPEFEVDGVVMQNILDGHHAFAAAKLDGVELEYFIATEKDDERIALLESSISDYLEASYIDTDWYNVVTGKTIW